MCPEGGQVWASKWPSATSLGALVGWWLIYLPKLGHAIFVPCIWLVKSMKLIFLSLLLTFACQTSSMTNFSSKLSLTIMHSENRDCTVEDVWIGHSLSNNPDRKVKIECLECRSFFMFLHSSYEIELISYVPNRFAHKVARWSNK